MKKIAFLGLLLMIFLVACGGNDSNNNEDGSQENNETEDVNDSKSVNENESENENESDDGNANDDEKTLDGLVEHFKESGFEIGDKTEKVPEMIGAVEGFGIELNGEKIEVYKYEPNSEDLEEIQSNEEYEMEGFGPFPALANGNFVIINHDEHSEEEEIVEVFNSF